MDENIKDTWTSLRGQAVLEWQRTTETQLLPALDERTIKVNSKTIIDPAPGNECIIIWFCSKNDYYLEIQLHSANAFSAIATKGDETLTWPTLPFSVYDRKNYTIAYLLEWLDKWIV